MITNDAILGMKRHICYCQKEQLRRVAELFRSAANRLDRATEMDPACKVHEVAAVFKMLPALTEGLYSIAGLKTEMAISGDTFSMSATNQDGEDMVSGVSQLGKAKNP